jgi:hypothetical protein
MTHAALIADLVARAEALLPGVTDRAVARTLLAEELALEFPQLGATVRHEIVAGAIAALEQDEFFGWEFCGDPFAEEPEPAEPEDI